MASGGAKIRNYLKVGVAKLTCCKEAGGNGHIYSNKNTKLMVEAGPRRPRLAPPLNTVEAKILRVIEELNNFLIKETEYDIYQSLREMVDRVINELRLILDFLSDKKLKEGSILKYWIFDIVEIAQDAQFIIDDRDPWNFSEMGSMLKPICRALRETKNHILQLGVMEENKSPVASSSLEEGEDKYVVELEEDVESMLHKLIFPSRSHLLCTICVVGMAGVGKTTLARKLYNHATVVDRFEPRVWVRVSGEWSNKEVLMKLILQVLHDKDQSVLLEEMENADNRSLQVMLKKHLRGKNFLVVLDNIGRFPHPTSILKALPYNEGNNPCSLLLTSRFQFIKYRLQTEANNSTFEIKPLDEDRSWQLFLKLLLFHNQQFPKQMEIKGKEMLRSCHGLPLSIKEVATQFVIKRQSGSEWEHLLESIDLSATLAVLESIYQGWPPQLKSHFLCLSFFKEGTTIRREKLLQVWAAGQVIPYEEGEEEEANFYSDRSRMNLVSDPNLMVDFMGYQTTFMKLIDESVIEVDISKDQLIKCIRINASFHTLATAKAEKEMVIEILKNGGGNLPSSREPRHRAIYCSRDEINHIADHDGRLVSLFFRGGGYFDANEPYWKRFEQLRTLDFESFGLKMLPETIGALTELRYLGLRDNYLQELPRSFRRLKNLEVLDIALNFMLEVPDIVWKIGSLRHIYMSDIICRKPLKIDALKNLETLLYISVDNLAYKVSSLKMMTNLRKLGIEEVDENSNVSRLFASLADFENLECLILRGFRFKSLPPLHGLKKLRRLRKVRLDGLITNLPIADYLPPGISHLSLINSRLDEDPMPQLGKFISLRYVKLKNAYTGQQMVITRNTIFDLQVLCIEELWHLRNIRFEKYVGLVKLEIRSCPNLEYIPEHVINSYKTKELKVLTTRKLAAKIRKSDFISKIERVDIQP